MRYLPKVILNAELTLIVVIILAFKASITAGELVPTSFLLDNFFTVLIIFSILDFYGVVKHEYECRFRHIKEED